MPDTKDTAPVICIIAGESSGDNLGAGLIDSIRERVPLARFIGVGGPSMQERGVVSLFPMSDLSVMGIAEVLPRIWLLIRRIRETVNYIKETKPDVVITIDSPDFCFRVAKKLKAHDIPLVHYVAPTVWAWRPKRAQKIAKLYDHLLTLFPFEPPYFEREGLSATFVGHPLAAAYMDSGDGNRFRRIHNLDTETPVLCLLPGSRHSEVSRLLPVFIQTLDVLRQQIPNLHATCPTVPHLENQVRNMLSGTDNVSVITSNDQKLDAYTASTAALAASGTVALELAMAKVPSVIGYMMSLATAFVARRLVRLPNVSLANILLDREIMPEFIQERCTPETLAEPLRDLLSTEDSRQRQVAAFEEVKEKLKPTGGTPNQQAADTILRLINRTF